MNAFVVMDIGGTSFRSAIFTEEKELKFITKENSDNFIYNEDSVEKMQNMFVEKILSIVARYKNKGDYTIKGVGISFPGPVNEEGTIESAPTLWGSAEKKLPLLEILKKRLRDIEVVVINDITAAGWRYKNNINDNFCIITVSSGIGNKVFWNDNVLLSKDSVGGEIGHFYYGGKYKNLKCDCGAMGHLGAISSGRGIEKVIEILRNEELELYSESMLFGKPIISTYDIVRGLARNDTFAMKALEESIRPLAQSIAFIYSCIGVKKFVIVGGFALGVGTLYVETLRRFFKEFQTFNLRDNVEEMIILGEKDDNHGLIGVGYYLENKIQQYQLL